ncbi:hypothetical protein GCM10012284_37360 [Mangrovihabitans endophyticus]|uniref:GDSL-like Lipase/Acylhydrolase family protein n=1 Tax=Mangrovihabitans endophyticus TaxID=1751298 RepID=A0A8J3C0C5_9ACTN|nr:hypothetical protein GCM10012284_37360 [Mangrovihabitans endophyticus]
MVRTHGGWDRRLVRKVFLSLSAGAVVVAAGAIAAVGNADAAEIVTAVGYGSDGWSYQQVTRGGEAGFEQSGYAPAAFWATGRAAFGTTGGACSWNNADRVHTGWGADSDMLLRRSFRVPAGVRTVRITGTVDNNADVYVNGALVQHVENGNCVADGIAVDAPVVSDNLLAVRAADTGTETFVDLQVTYSPSSVGPGRYVALGDSFASGEGAAEQYFTVGTSLPDPSTGGRTTTGCHRSVSSWNQGVLATAKTAGLVDRMDLIACSGAKAIDLFNANTTYVGSGASPEVPQIQAVTPQTTLVSLSIGGNDASFSDILKDCTSGIKAGAYDCRKKNRKAATLAEAGLKRLRSEGLDVPRPPTYIGNGNRMLLSQVYANVALAMAPGGTLVVTGYPRIFAESRWGYDRSGPTFSCKVGTNTGGLHYRVKYEDAQWLNGLADDINRAIGSHVDAANAYLRGRGLAVRVVFAPSSGQFTNHRLCSGSKWFNGVQFPGDPRAMKQLQTSMHPNLSGQQAYCRAAVAALPSRPAARCTFDTKTRQYR